MVNTHALQIVLLIGATKMLTFSINTTQELIIVAGDIGLTTT